MSSEMQSKIVKATAWSSITEISAKLVLPIVNLVLARVLTPEAFGAVATITIITNFFEIFTDAGFQKYLIQHEFENEEELNQHTNVAFWSNFATAILIFLSVVIFRNPLAKIVGSDNLGNGIAVASFQIVLNAFSSIQMARFKRDFNFKTLFISRIGSALIPLFITVPLAFVFKNYWALVFGTIATSLFNAIILTIKSKWKPCLFYKFKILKEMFSFSIWTMFESFSLWLTNSIGIFIVGNYLNQYYLGLYKTAMSTVNGYLGIITAAITPVLFSALSRYQNEDLNFKKSYYTFQRVTAVLVFPMGAGIFLFRDLVTQLLLGSQWTEASDFIGLWGLISVLSCVFTNFTGEVLRSKGKPKISLFLQLQHLIFLIPVLIWGAQQGFETLYITRSLIRIELMLLGLVLIKVMFGFKFADIFKNLLPPLVCTVIMTAVGYGLKTINNGLLWQFVCVAICIIVYFATLFTLFPKMRKELLSIPAVRKVLAKFKK